MCTDIQYKEGILEYLENNTKVDYIILNKDIQGNITTEELIKEINRIEKKIKVILVSNNDLDYNKIISQIKNEETTNMTKNISYNINKKIYNKKQSNIENNNKIAKNTNYITKKTINDINMKEQEKPKLKKAINKKSINLNLENMQEEYFNQNKINSNNSIFNQKTLPINNFYPNINQDKKVRTICILGPNGIGKSVFSVLFSQNLENKKSIIIDFDVLNDSLSTLLGVKKYEEKVKKGISKNDLINHNQKIDKFIIKTNLNVDLISGMNLILDPKYKLSYKKMKEAINELKENYDTIIVDTSAYNFFDYTKEIANLSEQIIFISGANLLELKKSEKLLNIYTNDWDINPKRINIIFNKCTNKSISDDVLKEMFKNYNILGKIQLNDYYDLVINKNMTKKSALVKDIEKIKKQIIKEKYSWN